MVRRCKTIRVGALLCLMAGLAAGCGGDADTSVGFPGPPPPAGPEVRGTVLMPNGRIAAAEPLSLRRLAALVVAEVRALSGNVEPVGRNERVSLSFLRNDGLEERDLGVVFTNDAGSYLGLFLPDGLTIDGPGGRFLVSVGFGSSLTRAFVCSSVSPTDIDFNSEAAVRLILDEVNSNPLVRLEDFSALEICEIVQAIRDLPGFVPGNNAAQINANATAIAGNDSRIRHLIQSAGGAAPTPTRGTPLPTATFTHIPTAPPTATPTTAPPQPTATSTATRPSIPEATNTPLPPGALVNVGNGTVNPNNQVVIEVILSDGGNIVGGLQNDIVFRNTAVNMPSAARCVLNPALGPFPQGPGGPSCEDDTSIGPCKTLNRDLRNCGDTPLPQGCPAQDPTLSRFRAIIAATGTPNSNRIPSGLLYTCTFDVVNIAQLPTVLDNMNIVVSDPLGERITDVGGSDGLATLGARIAAFAAAGSTSITVDSAASFPASGFLFIDNQLIGFDKNGNVLNLDAPLNKNADPADTVFLAPPPASPPTHTPSPTSTSAPTSTPTAVPADTATATPPTPGETPPTAVFTSTPTATPAPPTSTPVTPPTSTPVMPPTNTPVSPVPTSTPTRTPTFTFTPVTPSPTATLPAGPSINVGSVTGSAGAVVSVPVILSRGAGNIVAASTDIVYNPSQVRPVISGDMPDCAIEPAIGSGTAANKMLLAAVLSDSGDNEILRVGIIGFDNANPIPDGTLFTCNFRIAPAATLGTKPLINLPGASDAAGSAVAVGGMVGVIQVAGGGSSINVGTVAGSPGSRVTVPVILSDGAGLATASADIAYDASQVRVVVDGDGPDCAIDPAIGPGTAADKMLLLTVLNAGGNSRILRVGVISFNNANLLVPGTLFTCRFEIDSAASPGDKPLNVVPDGSNPQGGRLPVGGINGAINVL